MSESLLQASLQNKTEVSRAGSGVISLWLKLVTGLVKIDFLISERQGLASLSKLHHFHAQDPLVKGAGRREVAHREDEVVEAVDFHIQNLLKTLFMVS